jgi:hypothetical protein
MIMLSRRSNTTLYFPIASWPSPDVHFETALLSIQKGREPDIRGRSYHHRVVGELVKSSSVGLGSPDWRGFRGSSGWFPRHRKCI